MHLVQLFLPVANNEGQRFSRGQFDAVERELVDAWGGVTAYRRAAASGLWEKSSGEVHQDELLIFEVMVDQFNREWWRDCRRRLEREFRQERVLIRAQAVEVI